MVLLQTPSTAVDGYPENFSEIQPEIRQNEVEIDWTIQLIGSSEVELLNITATWTNPKALKSQPRCMFSSSKQMQSDSKGREFLILLEIGLHHLHWNFSSNGTNKWNETITRDHLDGAGIELDDASFADKYEVMLILIGGFEGDDTNRVLSIQTRKDANLLAIRGQRCYTDSSNSIARPNRLNWVHSNGRTQKRGNRLTKFGRFMVKRRECH